MYTCPNPKCGIYLAAPVAQCGGGRCPKCGYKPGDIDRLAKAQQQQEEAQERAKRAEHRRRGSKAAKKQERAIAEAIRQRKQAEALRAQQAACVKESEHAAHERGEPPPKSEAGWFEIAVQAVIAALAAIVLWSRPKKPKRK